MFEHPVFYLFPREAELRSILLQSPSEILLRRYALWRLSPPKATKPLKKASRKADLPSEEARASEGTLWGYLLCVEGQAFPEKWILPLLPASKQALVSLLFQEPGRGAEKRAFAFVEGEESLLPLPSPKEAQGGTHLPTPARLVRSGEHLFASLGLQAIDREKDAMAWALLRVPEERLTSVITEHLALQATQIRVGRLESGFYWLWLGKPDLFLLLTYLEGKQIEIFQSFSEEPALFTPWGQRSVVSRQMRFQAKDTLLLLDPKGRSSWLQTEAWRSLQEIVTLRDLPKGMPLERPSGVPSIPVSLRFLPADPQEIPTFWLLQGNEALPALETLFFDLPRADRSALTLFCAKRPHDPLPLYILRDSRPQIDSPLFSSGAIGFEGVLPNEGLFLQTGLRLSPNLAATTWRQVFRLSSERFTLLLQEEGRPTAILSAPAADFLPLESLIRVQMQAHASELQRMAAATTVEILFEPKTFQRPVSAASAKEAPTPETRPLRSSASPLTFRPQLSLQQLPKASPQTPSQLKQAEDRIRQAIQQGESLSTGHWLELASLYAQVGARNPDSIETSEALKALDEIFAVDPFLPEAVLFERHFLEEVLRLTGLSFAEEMACLDQALRSDTHLKRRLAWRMRLRMLLHDTGRPEEQGNALRLAFYRDLFLVEEILSFREHFLFVTEVANRLQDPELVERARLRYRSLLQDGDRLTKEQPKVMQQAVR